MKVNSEPTGTRQCSRCVMDAADNIAIDFDANGVCSFCHEWSRRKQQHMVDGVAAQNSLATLTQAMHKTRGNAPYDCIMGISGGLDSSFMAYHVKRLGWRPLLVHFDNGWNSELAVKNIENICNRLQCDLYTLVVDWEEFRDLQLAYLRASVVDIEVPTDHAIAATMHKLAAQHRIKFMISGMNIVTEGIMPREWRWDKLDLLNLKSIHAAYGTRRLKTYPTLGFFQHLYYQQLHRAQTVQLLNYLEYDPYAAKQLIEKELGWRDYGGKHYESIFTRFYQGYILPKKFGIDKRKAHFSCLINAQLMTRQEAIQQLAKPAYPEELLRQDFDYVLRKLALSRNDFEALMAKPPRSHLDFPSFENRHYRYYQRVVDSLRPLWKPLRQSLQKGRHG